MPSLCYSSNCILLLLVEGSELTVSIYTFKKAAREKPKSKSHLFCLPNMGMAII